MDADCNVRQRDQLLSRREMRWSVNSQKLDQIVAKMSEPIKNIRQSFDTDLIALLEEYLTEAGLRALDEDDGESGPEGDMAPNFTEVAMLVQQTVDLYSRKVDYLYQHVVNISNNLHNSQQEGPQTPSSSKRKAQPAEMGEFEHIALEDRVARREAGHARPPPTLACRFTGLEPREPAPGDVPLTDYSGDHVGLLDDIHCARRLQNGSLVSELECLGASCGGSLRPLSLSALQAALLSRPPPAPASPAWPALPLRSSTPHDDDHHAPDRPLSPNTGAPRLLHKERKRRRTVQLDDIVNVKLKIITTDLRRYMDEDHEFSISTQWIVKVIKKRKSHILSERRRLMEHEPGPPPDCDMIDLDLSTEVLEGKGFAGWNDSEVAAANATLKDSSCEDHESDDDDGFFEQSSVGESDASRTEGAGPGGDAWQAAVLQRAAAAQARSVDVRRECARVTAALAHARTQPTAFSDVLRDTNADQHDVSRLLLAALFLANAGNVEIVEGPPLSVNSFSMRLLSNDSRLYGAAADAELQPPPAGR